MEVCERQGVSSVSPSHGGSFGLQVDIVTGAGGGGGELLVPDILHSPDITDRWPGLLELQICQGSFASLGQPRQLQQLPGPANVDFMLAKTHQVINTLPLTLSLSEY